jgi:hypothetical protein
MGAELVIILFPTKEEAYAKYITAEYLDPAYLDMLTQGRQRLLNVCEERGWHCIDMMPPFQAAIDDGQTVYYAFDLHLDASGNKIVSDVVGNYLIENGLLEPRR